MIKQIQIWNKKVMEHWKYYDYDQSFTKEFNFGIK